jgi:hypothetical protein
MAYVEPFPISVPDRDLSDLRARLDRVRLPELLEASRQHDWRALEKRWNAIPHYRTPLDGLDVAFWHVPSPEPDALPLVLTHGPPGSVLEFENILGPLTDPVAYGGSAEDAFHVVVRALPGFGFSERPREPGWNPGRTVRAWADLMTALGVPTVRRTRRRLGRLHKHRTGPSRPGTRRWPAPHHAGGVTPARGTSLGRRHADGK